MYKNTPNILSAARIFLSPLILLFNESRIVLFLIIILCGLTDVLDGYIARKYKLATVFGAQLDSFADFVFFISISFYYIFFRIEIIRDSAIFILIIIVIRLLTLFICFIKNKKAYFLHTIANKTTGFFIYIVICIDSLTPADALVPLLLCIALLSAVEEMLIMIFIKSPDNNLTSILFHQSKK